MERAVEPLATAAVPRRARSQTPARSVLVLGVVGALLLGPGPLRASDGTLEINQTCAAIGCFAWDAPGFPVTLGTQTPGFDGQGTYRLTGNLRVPDGNTDAIEIVETHVTLDLNGFALLGYALGSGVGNGVAGSAMASYARIHNGTIRGFRNRGIALEAAVAVRIEGVTVAANVQGGIDPGPQSLVRDNVVEGNGQFGITVRDHTLLRDNVVTDSFNGPDLLYAGGRDTGLNLCEDGSCSLRAPLRRFYLTQATVKGAAALDACEPGFHMASFWEIREPSGLQYDAVLGYVSGDSGEGPPDNVSLSGHTLGWIRTGNSSNNPGHTLAGDANCLGWTSQSATEFGTRISLRSDWQPSMYSSVVHPWFALGVECDHLLPVWCVED